MSFRAKQVARAFKEQVDPKKSSGYGLISGKKLKKLSVIVITHVTHIFNPIPKAYKVSEIIMIGKYGKDQPQIVPYRPINLLRILTKVFEKYQISKISPK